MKPLSNIITLIIIFILMIFSATNAQNPEQKKSVCIGIVADGPWYRNDEILNIFKNEILDLLQGEVDIKFPDNKIIISDWTFNGISSSINKIMLDKEVNILLAMGIYSSALVSERSNFPKPVIAPFIIDRDMLELPFKDGASGVKNLTYISSPSKIQSDIKGFREILPFKKLTVISNVMTQEKFLEVNNYMQRISDEIGFELNIVTIERSVDEVISKIPADVEAVVLLPLTQYKREEVTRLIERLIERRLPSFTGFDREYVDSGIFAGIISDNLFQHRARRTALNIQRILSGEDPGSIPVIISDKEHIVINMKTARTINIFPPWEIMTEAELINDIRPEIERRLTLSSAVLEATQVNLDLAAKQRYVSAGQQDINEARSSLLPSVSVSGLQTFVNKDAAESSLGRMPERMLNGSATATQIIFSEGAWANYSVQKSLQTSRKEEFNQLRLDIIQESAIAYLNLLKAKTIENIQKENLKLTHHNHEIAQVRRAVGVSGPSEVYRWESEIASSRKSVIEANSRRNAAEITLNRLLHRPLEEPFITEEASLDEPLLFTSDKRFLESNMDKLSFRAMRDFFVKIGFEYSPELHFLDAAISARKRLLTSAKRAYWSPIIALQGTADNVFSRAGAGSEGFGGDLPPNMVGIFPEIKDFSWNIGFNVSFPLFEGGLKSAKHQKGREELRQLQIELESVQNKLEQGIRSYMHIAGASSAGIALSQAASDAAHKNLDLVQDAYSKGAVSIIELIDAQKAVLGADLSSANAVYTFMIDIINVQRSVGVLFVTSTQEERNIIFERMVKYIAEKREQ